MVQINKIWTASSPGTNQNMDQELIALEGQWDSGINISRTNPFVYSEVHVEIKTHLKK